MKKKESMLCLMSGGSRYFISAKIISELCTKCLLLTLSADILVNVAVLSRELVFILESLTIDLLYLLKEFFRYTEEARLGV